MKRLLLIPLSLFLLMQNMRGLITYVSLTINQDEIAANYCVNKNITMCYGSCYIEKQLKELETESQKYPVKSVNLKAETWLINQQIPTYNTQTTLSFYYLPALTFTFLSTGYINYSIDEIFQPPQYLKSL